MVDAENAEGVHKQSQCSQRVTAAQRHFLHQFEGEQRAIRVKLCLYEVASVGRRVDRRQLRQAAAIIARLAAEAAEIDHRHVSVGIAQQRHRLPIAVQ